MGCPWENTLYVNPTVHPFNRPPKCPECSGLGGLGFLRVVASSSVVAVSTPGVVNVALAPAIALWLHSFPAPRVLALLASALSFWALPIAVVRLPLALLGWLHLVAPLEFQ